MGGATRVLIHQIDSLQEAGHQVMLISGCPAHQEDALPCTWKRFTYKSLSYLPGLWRALKRSKQEFQPDVVHIHQPLIGALASLCFPNTTKLYHFHSYWREEKLSHATSPLQRGASRLKGLLERWTLKRMDRFIALSSFSASRLKETVPQAEVEIIPGAVDLSHFRTPEDAPKSFALVSVRRLDPRTGVDLLIRSWANFKSNRPDLEAQLNIVGDGRQREELEALVKSLKLEGSVELKGRIPEEELSKTLGEAVAVVIPTRELEGFGLSVIEAFAVDRPVIATPVGALPEFSRHGSDVFHCVKGVDVNALEEGIDFIYRRWSNNGMQMGACRRVAQEHYGKAAVAHLLQSTYAKLP